ncbi:hypothetical protein, partial [Bdellovibrio bacteriovorus]|uniref:hypothetical protein n=1 Tax=Bdellovibrio bacteriovorus TaxID=959 RepID=UPI000B2376E5
GDLTGTYPNPTIAASAINSSKIQDGSIATVDLASGTGAGQVFRFDGSAWQHTKLQYTDLVNGTGGSPWPTGSCSAGQYITWVSVLDGFTCSNLTSAAVTTALGFTPANQARTITAGTGLTGGGNLSADRTLSVDVGTGAGQIPQLDSSGKLAVSVIPSSVTNAQWTVSGADVYRPSGKVGIGTNTPYGLLDVRGATPQILISDSDNAKGSNVNGSLEFKDQYNVPLGDIGYFGTRDMFIRNADEGLNFGTGGNDGQMFINAAGNVGIGTTSPNERLDVAGKVKATEFCIGASCLTSWPATGTGDIINGGNTTGAAVTVGTTDSQMFSLKTGNTNRLNIPATGGVGIGLTSLASGYLLETAGKVSSREADPLIATFDTSNDRTSPNMTGGIAMYDSANAVAGYMNFVSGDSNADLYIGNSTGAGNGGLRFRTGNHLDRMYIDYLGNVGIGSITPQAKLDVAGIVRAQELCDENGANCKDLSAG